jgi:hypothetical protein
MIQRAGIIAPGDGFGVAGPSIVNRRIAAIRRRHKIADQPNPAVEVTFRGLMAARFGRFENNRTNDYIFRSHAWG